MPLWPKDNEGAVGKVKHLYTLLEVTTLTDVAFIKEEEK
jgi:hypothetical protein